MQTILALPFLLLAADPGLSPERPITTGTLLEEMHALDRLARLPEPAYRTVQFSSYDRRSTGPEAPGWFTNADGFGREPIPGFEAVLRSPGPDGVGLYLLADAAGPGAVVRGWSAGMGGVLRVHLDGAEEPVWEGPAYEFLARRSIHLVRGAGLELEMGDAFTQNDADYFPIPFAGRLRVTWEGKLGELHFYHLQVRLYEAGTPVRTFDPKRDVSGYLSELRAAMARLEEPRVEAVGETVPLAATLAPGTAWTWSPERGGPGAVTELALRIDGEGESLEEALRGVRLRISFDGSERHQVDAPLGDFFGSGPGLNPLASLPFTVRPDGTMLCRFVMPFSRSVALELRNFTPREVPVTGSVRISPWAWDARSMHFRAKWRIDHDLLAGSGVIDLPFAVVIGKGTFVGCAAMIMNPSGVPTAGGNWWGEGDEKILVDGEAVPSTFGTGSEDYFNYSWSRPDLFDHPFCGQPLCSGPDTAGHVSNHRFQILDAIPFLSSIAVYLELWSHNVTPGLAYARISYLYALPGAYDDHRGLMPADLRIPRLPAREPQALGGASGARFFHIEELKPTATGGSVEVEASPIATRKRVVSWKAEKGATLTVKVPVEKAGDRSFHLVAVHRPDGGTVRVRVNDGPLIVADGKGEAALRAAHAPRNLNVHFRPVRLDAGEATFAIECVEPGRVDLDYIWVR